MKYSILEKLPTDRAYLHFEAVRLSSGSVQVDYELVLPLNECDCRGTFDHEGCSTRPENHRLVWLDGGNTYRLPLGRTVIRTINRDFPFYTDGEIDLPFRDGAHQQWDNEKLGGLPVIYTRGDEHWAIETNRPAGIFAP